MLTVINQDYSAYYKGVQNIKKYSSNRNDQPDSLEELLEKIRKADGDKAV